MHGGLIAHVKRNCFSQLFVQLFSTHSIGTYTVVQVCKEEADRMRLGLPLSGEFRKTRQKKYKEKHEQGRIAAAGLCLLKGENETEGQEGGAQPAVTEAQLPIDPSMPSTVPPPVDTRTIHMI